MLPIKLNQIPYNFPTEANEVTLGQFLALRRAKDILDEVCALTGMERQTILNFKGRADLQKCHLLLSSLGTKLSKALNGDKLPKQCSIGHKTIRVPKNPKMEPVGAFIAVHNLITDEYKRSTAQGLEFDPTNIIPQVLAHYLWLPYMGDGALYSDEKIEDEAWMEHILSIPVTEALPMANFFFRKYPN
jgi:hypothetical protein